MKLNTGTFESGGGASTNYNLHTVRDSDEKLYYTHNVSFPESYSIVPEVYVTLNKFDLSDPENTKIGINVKDITENGFEVEIYTRAKSRVFTGEVSWFSY